MPTQYRSMLDTMDVIMHPKVSQCLHVCVGEVQYQVWMNMPTHYRSMLVTMDVITHSKVWGHGEHEDV